VPCPTDISVRPSQQAAVRPSQARDNAPQ